MRPPCLPLVWLLVGCACANQSRSGSEGATESTISEAGAAPNPEVNQMHITIGSRTFVAELYDNPTGRALKAMLPVTLSMTDLNANEKYHHFANDLPSDASKPGMIQAGDLMLYESNSLVLFYESFSTPYSYTPVGKLADASGLAEALGSGNVTITFAR